MKDFYFCMRARHQHLSCSYRTRVAGERLHPILEARVPFLPSEAPGTRSEAESGVVCVGWTHSRQTGDALQL